MSSLTLYRPTSLPTEFHLPASKSISNRALVISALAGGCAEKDIENISDCDDSQVVVKALRQCAGKTAETQLVDIMAAGTAMRFLTACFSVTEGSYVITGTERMKHRPIGILVDALRALGADIAYEGEEGFPPLRIRGRKLDGGAVSLSGQVSSQYVSALLMIGPTMKCGLTLTLEGNIVSRPYIDMTTAIMRAFGAEVAWKDERTVCVAPKPYAPVHYRVENDWSAASYWYELIALGGGEALLPGLFEESLQGDARVQEFFKPLGVTTEFTGDGVKISGSGHACGGSEQPLVLDLVEQPDLAQTLVCTCAFMNRTFRFTGLQSLKIKETDRIYALRTELAKLGYDIEEEDDSVLFWNGRRRSLPPLEQVSIDTYDDHRMAMAFACACLPFGVITVNAPEVVSKSYPNYWQEFPQSHD